MTCILTDLYQGQINTLQIMEAVTLRNSELDTLYCCYFNVWNIKSQTQMRKTRSFINKGFKPIKYKLTNLHFMTINQALKFISNKKLKKRSTGCLKQSF